MMHLRLVRQEAWTIYALAEGNRCWALGYIEGLQEPDRKKIVALLDRTAEFGPPQNLEKFRAVKGDLMEFKSFQDRLFCFFDGPRVLVLTHGVRKQRNRHSAADIRRAETLREAYIRSKGG
jgi:hypothetical protein